MRAAIRTVAFQTVRRNKMNRKQSLRASLTLVVSLFALVAVLWARVDVKGGKVRAIAAGARNLSVTIIAVNPKEGVVTAKDTAGIMFEFPATPATLKGLKVGAKVNTKFIKQAVSQAASLSGAKLPFCACGKMNDGKCWCSKCPGDPCFKIGCPYGECRQPKTGPW